MIRIILAGYSGKMGGAITAAADACDGIKIVAGIGINPVPRDYPTFKTPAECNIAADAVIDFSGIGLTLPILDYCMQKNLPLVMGTTGISDEIHTKIKNAAKKIPVFYATNMSYGVFVFNKLAKYAAQLLKGAYDIEIIESHHRLKADSPSGTAKTLLKEIQSVVPVRPVYGRNGVTEKRTNFEVGLHSVRGGTIAGRHEVLFAGSNETIEIRHNAESKEIFALGSLKAAEYLVKQKAGYYGMENLIADEVEN